jgi:Arc/MetJ-type ribon-helix-helix transcriptional regulator
MLEELKDFFGSGSRSDVIRSAIRILYVNLLGKANA